MAIILGWADHLRLAPEVEGEGEEEEASEVAGSTIVDEAEAKDDGKPYQTLAQRALSADNEVKRQLKTLLKDDQPLLAGGADGIDGSTA